MSGPPKRTTVVISNGGPAIRGPYSTEPARLQVLCLAMQGLGKPGCNQAKMIEWALGRRPGAAGGTQTRGAHRPRRRLPGRHAVRVRARLLHPQDAGAQAHPRRRGHLVRQQIRHAQRPRRPVHPVQVPGRRLLQDPHDLDRLPLLDHLLERRQQLHPGAARSGSSSSSCASIPGSRTTRCSPTSSCRSTPSWRKTTSAATSSAGRWTCSIPEPRCMESLGESVSDYEVVCKIAEKLGMSRGVHRGHDRPRDHQIGLGVLRPGRQDLLGGV